MRRDVSESDDFFPGKLIRSISISHSTCTNTHNPLRAHEVLFSIRSPKRDVALLIWFDRVGDSIPLIFHEAP